ncbi:MAG TPA: pseudouridine synthase [Fibrobacteria bacterium]|nr:pseudouridine synthase [Fibrobacteria bacterium]
MLAQPKRTHLNRALSKLGLCSRGIAESWIAEGRVSVNGVTAVSAGQWVELGKDRIEVAPGAGPGALLPASAARASAADPADAVPGPPRARTYLLLHKPAGYVTTRSDELGRETVYDLLPPDPPGGWLFPVGRLDKDSEGLLLMTDDGEWANLLTDPAFHVEKIYRVKLDGKPLEEELQRFRAGILLDGSATLPARAEAEGGGWCRVGITEGRNRQIRRMFHALGYKVKRLVRVAIGPLELGGLKAGRSRRLTREEVDALRRAASAGKS